MSSNDEQQGLPAAQLRHLLEGAAEAIIMLDRERRIVYLNRVAEQLARVERAAVLGRQVWEAFPQIIGSTFYHHIERAVTEERAVEFEDGSPQYDIWLIGRVYPSPDGFAIYFQDVAARKQAETAREQALAEVATERARLFAILEQLPVGVAVAAVPTGELLYRNAEAVRLLGSHPPTPANHTDYQHYGGLHADGTPYAAHEYPLARAVLDHESVQGEDMWYRRSDGALTNLSVYAAPITVGGKVIAAVSAFQDIAAQKRAEEWQRFLAEAGAALAESLDYEVTLARAAQLAVPRLADWCFVDLLGEDGHAYRLAVAHADPTKEDLAREARNFPADPQFRSAHPPTRALVTGQSVLIVDYNDAIMQAAARNEAHLRLSRALALRSVIVVPLVARGRALGVLTFATTAESERRFGADELAVAEELARRCGLALDNAQLYRQAREALHLRDQFVAIASHELKTPVTSAKGYLQLLARQLGRGTTNTARLQRYLQQTDISIGRLETLVSDLLDASRIQQGRLDLRPERFDLVALGEAVVDRFERAAERVEGHTLLLASTGPVTGSWDRDRLDQVLTNLVSNALKYSPAGGEVRVTIGWDTDTTPKRARIIVSDQGVGIPPDEQASLFQPFARSSVTNGIGGTGLGLYIVRQIVEAHGGTVSLASTPGQGTTVTVLLPGSEAITTQANRRHGGGGEGAG
ncbi:MAG TPA: ATP-binding protein [Thermomicrobiales bacterium]